MVLASGEIVQANENQNADLFWAIRGNPHSFLRLTYSGGGCNFGVVTEFTYRAYDHAYPVYSGMLVYTPGHVEAIVDTINKWFPTEDGQNPKTAFFLVVAMPPPHFQPTLVLLIFYDGDETEGRRIFKPFFDISPVADLTREHPYVEMVPSSLNTSANLRMPQSTR